jgi:hypothetical protein
VPDLPIMADGAADVTGRRQTWGLGPGWVVAWKAVCSFDTAIAELGGSTWWIPSDRAAAMTSVQLELNGHDQVFTDGESRVWQRLSDLHALQQGWLPWLARVEPGDVWGWSVRRSPAGAFVEDSIRTEIALQFISDRDLQQQLHKSYANPAGSIALARNQSSRYIQPPEDGSEILLPGQESGAQRLNMQNGPGKLVAWCGSAKAVYGAVVASETPEANAVEVQAAWNDGETLVNNGSGPDWLSLYILFGGRGGRRWQPLCRAFHSGDQMTTRYRDVRPVLADTVEVHPKVVYSWQLDRDLSPRGR